jgi:hypothetical protein
MTRLNRILIRAGIGAVLVFLVASYFVSPVIALQGLTTAAKAGDRAKLEQHIDFPAVRESLKAQLKAAMTRSFAEDPKLRDNPFAALGQMLLVGVVDKAVDAYATPDAIANMVATNRPPKSISTASNPPPVEQPKPKTKTSTTESHLAYQDLNHFHASYRDKGDPPGDELGLVMERRGLFTWKLVKIELPPHLGK